MRLIGEEMQEIAQAIHEAYAKHEGRIPVCIFTREMAIKIALERGIQDIRRHLFNLGFAVDRHLLIIGTDGLFFMNKDQAKISLHPGWKARISIPFESTLSRKTLLR